MFSTVRGIVSRPRVTTRCSSSQSTAVRTIVFPTPPPRWGGGGGPWPCGPGGPARSGGSRRGGVVAPPARALPDVVIDWDHAVESLAPLFNGGDRPDRGEAVGQPPQQGDHVLAAA